MIEYDYEEQFKEALSKIDDNNLKKKLVAIKKLVVERLNLENEFKREHNALEYKYEQQYIPIYEERKKIISGEKTPNIEDIKDKLEEIGVKEEDLAEQKEKGIPKFWLKCIENTSEIETLNDKDKKILEFLTDISYTVKENGDFTLIFTFDENEYFTPNVLEKEFILDKEFEIKEIKSTEIIWKDDEHNPTIELKKKKLKNKKTKEIKTVVKKETVPSFFGSFKNYEKKDDDKKDEKDESDDEESEEDDYDNIEDQYDIGLQFKDEIIPFAIEYYLGIVDDDDEDFDDEEEEEEEEESSEEQKHKKSKRKH